jgi:hypothetical protein
VDRLLPGMWQLRHYQRGQLRGDVIAGVTVAVYLVPQVMAYAEVAGLPAISGLWAVVAPLAVYAVLGSSRQLSVGPESTTALMTSAAVGALVAGNSERYAEAAAALASLSESCVSWGGSPGWASWRACYPALCLHDLLTSGGFVGKVGEERIFMTLPTAIDAYVDWYVDRHGSTPQGLHRPPR